MGTTAEKMIYLDTTKTQIKDGINRLGGELTNLSTFRSYAEALENVYNDLPKVTGEGSNLSLTPIRKGGLSIIPKGACEQDGTPTPDDLIPVKVVTGDNSVVVSNANLYNKTTMAFVRGVIQEDETVSTANPHIATSGKISLKKGTYTFYNSVVTNWLFYIQVFKNGTRIYQTPVGSNAREHTFTLDDDYDVHLQLNTPMGSGVNVDEYLTDLTNNAFLLAGEIATEPSYIEHQEQTYTLHLGTNYLAGIGDYKDEIVGKTDDWKIVRQIRKLILNGSENWQVFFNTDGIYLLRLADPNLAISNDTQVNIISYYYKGETRSYIRNNLGIVNNSCASNNNEYIVADKSKLTVQNFKTWLTEHNVTSYYILKTPIEETITDTTLITDLNNMYQAMGYDGTTNITITSDTSNAQMIASVSALKGE